MGTRARYPRFTEGCSGRKTQCLPGKLAGLVKRPLGAKHSGGLQDSFSTPSQSSSVSPVSREEATFISAEVLSLLQIGAVERVTTSPRSGFFSTIFTVPKTGREHHKPEGNKPIPIPPSFPDGGIPTLRDLISQGDFMFKLDLKDAYFMVPICPLITVPFYALNGRGLHALSHSTITDIVQTLTWV